jgi:hypothetical protein
MAPFPAPSTARRTAPPLSQIAIYRIAADGSLQVQAPLTWTPTGLAGLAAS